MYVIQYGRLSGFPVMTASWSMETNTYIALFIFTVHYVNVHAKKVTFAHLTEIKFLIHIECLDTAMSNSASGGFISVLVLKFVLK